MMGWRQRQERHKRQLSPFFSLRVAAVAYVTVATSIISLKQGGVNQNVFAFVI